MAMSGGSAAAQETVPAPERYILFPIEARCVDALEAGQLPDLSLFPDPFGAAGLPLGEGEQRAEVLEGLTLYVRAPDNGVVSCDMAITKGKDAARFVTKDVFSPAIEGWIDRFVRTKGYALWPGCANAISEWGTRVLFAGQKSPRGNYVAVVINENLGGTSAYSVQVSEAASKPEGC